MKEWLLAVIGGVLLVAALSMPGCTIPACPECPPVDTAEIVVAIDAIDFECPDCPDIECPDMDCPDIEYPAYERVLESADVYNIIRNYWIYERQVGWTIKSITPTYLSNGIWKCKVTFAGSNIRYFYFSEIRGYIR